ncbi:hypothetical protein [Dehalogenimonas etheniformans]|uniref:Uncharacterized protein n=1 Tax=Dehalogenimonas etheniformans TaxID=1536648 RepID=A0A2P5P7V0_9CHLR|nr:hypothetical protein [Dehalogenimonas etheniformans]PPD58383.1 hypothetical protein JP09_004560 [Dehalogenimonas etheniformans]QNT76958.1 hypothetical protein HX448_09860 [Dehalogenimonas etheniformans]
MADNKSLEFDTWLLRSVMLANVEGSGTPERIANAADLMSKTPMAATDLRAGLARLAQRGFVQEANGSFSATQITAGLKWNERDKIRQLLLAEPERSGDMGAGTSSIGKVAGDYVKRFQGFMSGLTNPKKE